VSNQTVSTAESKGKKTEPFERHVQSRGGVKVTDDGTVDTASVRQSGATFTMTRYQVRLPKNRQIL